MQLTPRSAPKWRRGERMIRSARDWHAAAPDDVVALIGLGTALEAARDDVGAARIYGSLIDLFPGRADLRRFAGEPLERVADRDPAVRGLIVDTYRRDWRYGAAGRTRSTKCAAVSAMRRAVQLGQRPRPLQLNATTISSWQVWQRTRVKPCARMPQRR